MIRALKATRDLILVAIGLCLFVWFLLTFAWELMVLLLLAPVIGAVAYTWYGLWKHYE